MQSSEGPNPVVVSEALPAEPLVDHHGEESGEHVHLPPPSIWPITSAFGVAVIGFGLVTSIFFWVAGLAIMMYGLIMWIQELRHEPH